MNCIAAYHIHAVKVLGKAFKLAFPNAYFLFTHETNLHSETD